MVITDSLLSVMMAKRILFLGADVASRNTISLCNQFFHQIFQQEYHFTNFRWFHLQLFGLASIFMYFVIALTPLFDHKSGVAPNIGIASADHPSVRQSGWQILFWGRSRRFEEARCLSCRRQQKGPAAVEKKSGVLTWQKKHDFL